MLILYIISLFCSFIPVFMLSNAPIILTKFHINEMTIIQKWLQRGFSASHCTVALLKVVCSPKMLAVNKRSLLME